jgi:hypothetical protein
MALRVLIINHNNTTSLKPCSLKATELAVIIFKDAKIWSVSSFYQTTTCYCLRGGIAQGVPYTTTITDHCASPSEMESFLIHPPELSGSSQQTPCSKAEKTWRKMWILPASIYHTIGIFNMSPALLPIRRKMCYGFELPLKIDRPRKGLNPRTLGPVASTITTRPPTDTHQTRKM